MDALRDFNFAVQAFRQGVADHFGVGMRETQAAAYLVTHGELSAGDLSRLLDLTPSTITHLLGRVHRAGLADTATDPDDHRRTVVRPTQRAEDMVAEIRVWLDSCFDVFEGSDISLDVVVAVLERLGGGLREARASLPAPTASDRAAAEPGRTSARRQ